MAILLPKKLKDQSHNTQNRRLDEITSHIFETYNNAVRWCGFNMHQIESYIAMTTILTFPYTQHNLPHWKFVVMAILLPKKT